MAPTNSPSLAAHTGTAKGPHFALAGSRSPAPPQLREVQKLIEEIIDSCEHKHEAVQQFLDLAARLTNANDVAFSIRHGDDFRIVNHGDAGLFRGEEREELLRQWAGQTARTGLVQLNQFADHAESIATLPVFLPNGDREALHAALLVHRGQVEPLVVSLQLLATGISAWQAREHARRIEFEARISSATIELLAKCNDQDSLAEAYFTLVTELQRLIGCTTVAYASRGPRQQRFLVEALSGASAIDPKSRFVCDLADCAAEAESRGTLTVWPPLAMADQHTSRIHQHLIQNHGFEAVASVPLQKSPAGEGVLIFLGQQARLHQPNTQNILRSIAPHLAGTLHLRKQADAGPLARVGQRLRKGRQRKTRRGILFALLLGGVAMLAPLPHKISCDCVVEPTVKRFATVPFDGILAKSFVKPGDMVSAGQVLAQMDDLDLRFERSESTAARTQALKEADVHLSKGKIADAQIAQFKAAELQAKLKWIGFREDHLEIKTQIDGVVIEGDLEQAEGAPVRNGQVLFEVAPLDSLKLKLVIPEQDIAFVDEAMDVDARLDGAPGRQFAASLTNIKPRASAEAGKNVFKADARLSDGDLSLRPGMSGTAKIVGPKRPLGWIVFHRAYRKVVDFIDW